MLPSARTFLVPVLLFSLAGCGLKGPLYLPDEQPDQVPPVAEPAPPASQPGVLDGSKVRTPLPPAPQSQKKDRERTTPPAAPTQPEPTPSAPTETAPTQPATPIPPPEADQPVTIPPPGQ
jgi:predicted small lipoprotein YifL